MVERMLEAREARQNSLALTEQVERRCQAE